MISKITPIFLFFISVNIYAQTITDIYTIHQDSTFIGREVAVVGIVTASTGIFDTRRTFIQDQDGGPWSGIAVWDDDGDLYAQIGDLVRVIGTVTETNGLTEIQATSFYIFSSNNTIPDVQYLNTSDIVAGSSTTEPYESILVQVTNVVVDNDDLGDGEWSVDDGSGACRIDDEAADLIFDIPDIGAPLNSITGILVFQNDNFKLEPRYRSDINEMPYIQIGDTLTIIQRPLLNIPAISQPGDTLEILCDLSASPASWSASLIYGNSEILLYSLDELYDGDKELWTLRVLLPDSILSKLYDLKLEIPGEETDISENSVQIIPHYKDDFYFIHITDTHLPTHNYCRDDFYQQDSGEVADLREVINDVNIINPAFVLHTGDLINEGELEDYLYNRYYTRAKRVLSEFDVPLYLVSGNHDLGGWSDTPMSDGTARRNWWRFFGWKNLDNPPGLNPQYTQDYFFNYGNCHLVGMEAYINYDRWRSEIYNNNSFVPSQLEWLQNHLSTVDDTKLKILFYHYDFYSDINLSDLGVDMALWGHTHGDSYTPGEYPISISTQACSDGRRAYRLIRVKGDSILPSPTLHAGTDGENLVVNYQPANDGSNYKIDAVVTNNLDENFEHAQIRFIMPKDSKYPQITGGSIVQIEDTGEYSVYYVAVDIKGNSTQTVQLSVYSASAGPFAENCLIDHKYLRPGLDTLRISTGIVNPDSHSVRVRSFIESSNLSFIDTLDLFDDGTRGDSTAGDGIYSGIWAAIADEKKFSIHVNTMTEDSLFNNTLSNAASFTTIGPITFDSLYIAQQVGDLFRIRIFLKNEGHQTSATDINAHITLTDFSVQVEDNYRSFDEIDPGQSVQSRSFYSLITNNPPDSLHGKIDIYSDDVFFWSDSFSIGFVPTGIQELEGDIPLTFELKQNYPNPFNPETRIQFEIPQTHFVTIAVYNMLGQKVRTLVDKNSKAGRHVVNWDGRADEGFIVPTGIYIYRIMAGDFIASKKMLMLK